MGQLVQIKLGEYRSVVWVDAGTVAVHRHDMVILEVQRNLEFGKVISEADKVSRPKTEVAVGKIVRLASDGDLRQVVNNEIKSIEALKTCKNKVDESKIDMQLVQAEYSFDATKILVFFTAEGRVDFRNLVKDLAKVLRVRIELKQIGAAATNYTTLTWTSNGTGTFTNANSLSTCTYTPSAADINAGSVTLTLTASSVGCSDDTSTKLLTIYTTPTITTTVPSTRT